MIGDKLLEMDLHEELEIFTNLYVLRVLGGWIYQYYNTEDGQIISAVFVPEDKE